MHVVVALVMGVAGDGGYDWSTGVSCSWARVGCEYATEKADDISRHEKEPLTRWL